MNLRPLAGRASIVALAVTLTCGASRAAAQDAPPQHPAVVAAQRIRAEVAKMRGLEYLADVKVGVKTPAELKAQVLEDFETEAPAEEVAKQEKVFKLLGLLPQDYDLRASMITFLSEQIGGFYDPEKKELFLIDQSAAGGQQVPGAQEAMDEMVMAHELHHALQDQNFDLTRWFELLASHDDRIQGYKSLVEGEAQLVGMTYLFGKMGRGDVDMAGLNRMQEMALRMSPEGEKMRKVPPFLLENLMFPYTQGAEFVQKMQRERGWARIGQAFNDPPSSTEQILHPEKFYGDQRDEPMELMLPDFASAFGEDAKVDELYENTLGEFNVVLLLRALGANKAAAAKAAAGWDGDRFEGFETEDGRVVLVWLTTWDSEAEAQEFEAAYRKALGATAQRHLERRGSEVLLVGGANAQEQAALVRKGFAAIKYEPRFVPLPGLTSPPSREDFAPAAAQPAQPGQLERPTGPNGSRLYHFDSVGTTLGAPEGFAFSDDPVGQLQQMGSVHLEGPNGARARLLRLPIPLQNADEQLQVLITQGVPDAEVRSKERTRAFGRDALWIDFLGTLPREKTRSWCRVLVLDLGPDSLAIGASVPDGQGDPQQVIEALMQTLWVDGGAAPGVKPTTVDAASFEAPADFVATRQDRAGAPLLCSLEHPSGAKVQVVRGAPQTALADSTRALEAQLPLVLEDYRLRSSGMVTRRGVQVHELDFTAAGRRTRQLTVDAAGQRWTVTCSAPADRFGEHLAAFGRVLASFKVADSAQPQPPMQPKPEQQKTERRAY